MKEELKKYLKENAFNEMWFGCSTESWMNIIDKFFDQHQPERLSEKDHIENKLDMISDSPTRENK